MECTNCGAEIAEGQKFCPGCGRKIRIIYAERTCSNCNNTWRPRKPNPKTCPKCGYALWRDSVVEIEEVFDLGDTRWITSVCIECGRETRNFAQYYKGHETKHQKKPHCYICIIKKWIERLKETDMLESTFDTSEMSLKQIDDAIKK